MSRAEILADTIARLEAERYAPLPPRPAHATDQGPSRRAVHNNPGASPVEAAANLRLLMEAVHGDAVVVAFSDREAM
jgi:hypothetical protein